MLELRFDENNDSGHTIQRLVLDFVGRGRVASRFGVTRNAVAKWYKLSRVPVDSKHELVGMAREKGLLITPEDL